MTDKLLPTQLKLVSFMWLSFGVVSLIQTITSIFYFNGSTVAFYLNLLGFWIANGLLRLSPKWRSRAVVISYINIIGWSILIIVVLFYGESWSLWWIPIIVLETVAMIWGVLILQRADIRVLFTDEGATA
jgi:hypothetical protein